jgi:hypothetical protein
MNHTELKQAIQDVATNSETTFVSHIDEFITMTEKRIIDEAELPLQQNSTQLLAVIGNPVLDVSTVPGYLAVDSLATNIAGAYRYLDNKEEEYLRAAYPNPTIQGAPRLYNVYDHQTLKLAPTPDVAYTMELRYFSYPPSIVNTMTSWLGTNFPHALLYGALRDAAVYLKEEADIVAMYEGKYNEALNEIKSFADRRSHVDSYRNRN